MDLMVELKKRSVLVDAGIEEYLPLTKPIELYKAARYLPDAGGKRLRPVIMMLTAEALGEDCNKLIQAAVAVELVHNFTLVHDDIMDQDDMRRGMPAVHVKWGEAGAILAGDTLYSKAFEILTQAQSTPEKLLKCVDVLSKVCRDICEGQWLDVEFEERDNATEEEYLDMIEKKTGVLYAGACKIGAILGGASDDLADDLYEFGRLIGIAFQIYDDVIDMTTSEDVLGKIRGSDLMEGKKTLIAIHALNNGARPEIFGKGNATQDELNDAVKMLEEAGSIDYARDLALSYVSKGKRLLDALEDGPAKDVMLAVADYMIQRAY